jgi:hypothetical protein
VEEVDFITTFPFNFFYLCILLFILFFVSPFFLILRFFFEYFFFICKFSFVSSFTL